MWNIVGGRVCSGIAPAKGYKWHFKDKTLALQITLSATIRVLLMDFMQHFNMTYALSETL